MNPADIKPGSLEEKIIEYSRLSVEDRLKWLEAALVFNSRVFSDKDNKVREQIKNLMPGEKPVKSSCLKS
jgi:hypothetical protein